MSERDITSPPPSAADVQLVAGRLADHELAAVAVAVAAMSAVAREEAHERELAERSGAAGSGWSAPYSRMASAYAERSQPGPQSWQFSHR